jgi:hypothetical protein
MKSLFLREIDDEHTQENFVRIQDEIRAQAFLKGQWNFVELPFTAAVSNFRFKHNMTFTPKDVILTSSRGAGVATFNFDLFTNEFLDISVTAAVVLRFFMGSYNEVNRV